MIPSTLTGVLAFLASVGPGYVYVRIVEQWRPYVQRTSLREAAEMVVSGSLATLLGVFVAVITGNILGFLDLNELALRPGLYLVENAENTGLGLLVVLLVSYGLAWAIARGAPGKGPKVFPDSGWFAAFERVRPAGHAIVATAELRDGRKLTGLVRAFTAEQMPVDERELTLSRTPVSKMQVLMPGVTEPSELDEEFIVLRGSEIVYVAATFVPPSSGKSILVRATREPGPGRG